LQNPSEIAGDPFGHLYVVDYNNHHIQIFDGIRRLGALRNRSGEFSHPTSVAISEQGDLYVVDKGNRRVQIFRIVTDEMKVPLKDRR
jgi:DNA-binding beta-propeller fold protein YncE